MATRTEKNLASFLAYEIVKNYRRWCNAGSFAIQLFYEKLEKIRIISLTIRHGIRNAADLKLTFDKVRVRRDVLSIDYFYFFNSIGTSR